MKKNHKREILLARIVFAAVLVIVALVIALLIAIISSHVGRDDSAKKQETQATETQIRSEKVKKEKKEEKETETEAVKVTNPPRWTTDKVNFRKKPSTDAKVIETLEKGVQVELLAETEGWANVQYNGKTGFIKSDYLTDQGTDKANKEAKKDDDKAKVSTGQASKNHTIVIDPGHQASGDSSTEPNGPGSATMKAKVSAGATGVSTGVPEYQLNLDVSLLLEKELKRRGYTVKMTRNTNDVRISNKERAEMANDAGADIAIRIHANSVDDGSVRGALTVSMSRDNPYVAGLYKDSMRLSDCVLDAYCRTTDIKNRGCTTDDGMTGINWSRVPVTILELGFMSNSREDELMQESAMQKKMAKGIADGIDAYFQ